MYKTKQVNISSSSLVLKDFGVQHFAAIARELFAGLAQAMLRDKAMVKEGSKARSTDHFPYSLITNCVRQQLLVVEGCRETVFTVS